MQMNSSQSGQTIIETIGAIFILVTALTGGLALTIYILSNSEINQNQLIGSNLAQEGVEIVRMMRDTNWLASDAKGGTWALVECNDIAAGQYCYPKAYEAVDGISPSYDLDAGDYSLDFDTTDKTWSFGNGNYNLYRQTAGDVLGAYTQTVDGHSTYARKIILTKNANAPYTVANPELQVQSIVAWRSKKCAWVGQDPSNAPASCRIEVDSSLTNWKDY